MNWKWWLRAESENCVASTKDLVLSPPSNRPLVPCHRVGATLGRKGLHWREGATEEPVLREELEQQEPESSEKPDQPSALKAISRKREQAFAKQEADAKQARLELEARLEPQLALAGLRWNRSNRRGRGRGP